MRAGASATLSDRVLGRSTLQRQHLLARAGLPVPEMLEHLVGLQGQVPGVPYTALWSRVAAFDPEELSSAMAGRTVVRAPLMRTTLHTVTARDCLALQPLTAPVLARTFASTAWARRLRGQDLGPALDAAGRLVAERPLTRAALAQELDLRFPELDATSLAWAFSYLAPVLQATPRGLWRRSGPSALTTIEAWLGEAPGAGMSLQTLVRRYLVAFGPASVNDVQAWCGLTRLREVTDGMDLRRYRSTGGAELLDLPDAAVPDEEAPAPVRFLGEYDNALIGYADRSRTAAGSLLDLPRGGPGGAVGTVLVDAAVRGTWALRRRGDGYALTVHPRASLRRAEKDEVLAEATALGAFLTVGADVRVEVARPEAG
ncbi:winged helix DNA-binding domain-containing protein [Georgenia sp. EYE_87]|uniref:winged helix DNA-binding domain-containing protein n=1 Tax=Georgenia sp. EYE_87 TaxID=2853448 RepID=UPI0020038CD6|nr:winged helix DNA-binding domain-containing protein [Georgenia sp. EYE_87]MCK6211889.1 winged helix DNA-binding domain-containing protein [Georgenia sp. EYE_87]